ncbi:MULTISPECIES: DUF7426 family protein [unclassified Nocardioides]|uniref:DUF7426 family protein n=1 Tax=unclassified Nocardioides TaxID=2615069 RepID=UPI0009F12BEB|nr:MULTISPECIES: hypothetical protein [unclassified Nocardioides]GAW50616.1 uncharacterized protein PD653B2_2952 [Nocardioides sp. PD653-B2]GAW55515.1 uncharacterized protein PD653_2940 [Nocardioides sp. PD653]
MAFKDLKEYVEPWLDLPINGKTYRVNSVDADTGIYCQLIVETVLAVQTGAELDEKDVAGLKLDDDAERDFNRRLLGTTYDEMLADKVAWEYVKIASRTVFTWTIRDRDAAEEFWMRGGRPEAHRPATKDRQRPAKKTTKKTAASR